MKKTPVSARQIAVMSVLTAVSAVLLIAANVLPGGKIGALALSSFPLCMILLMYGRGWAAGAYAVASALGLILLPGAVSISFVLFFGYYPIVKSILERIRRPRLTLVFKTVLYILLFALYILLAKTLFAGQSAELPIVLLFIGGAAAFAVYDFVYSLLIRLYIEKFARYFHD